MSPSQDSPNPTPDPWPDQQATSANLPALPAPGPFAAEHTSVPDAGAVPESPPGPDFVLPVEQSQRWVETPPPPQPPAVLPTPAVGYRRRLVGLVVAAVLAVALYAAGLATGLYIDDDDKHIVIDTRELVIASMPGTIRSSQPPSRCGVQTVNEGGKAVSPPDFASAPLAGLATLRIYTSLGELVISMDRSKTPCTVASLQHLAEKRFYEGTTCHRLTTEGLFVLQCGDPRGDGTGGPGYSFADENLDGSTYERGVVAMANSGAGTNGSQFFINYQNNDQLSPDFTVFGTVTGGMDIVDRVAAGGHGNEHGDNDGMPRVPLTFQSVTVT